MIEGEVVRGRVSSQTAVKMECQPQGVQGALYWVYRRTASCGSLAPGAFRFLLGLGASSGKSRENRAEFRSQTSGCERPYRHELQVQLQAKNTGTNTG
jgi:hypothetical protein